jgi:hypothetical protein
MPTGGPAAALTLPWPLPGVISLMAARS